MISPRIKAIFLFCLALTFGVLIFGGYLINREKPPIPAQFVGPAGELLLTGDDIIDGQNYYFSRGGQHIGTIWGHGSYLAPDWSADYLHRMGLYLAARHHGLDSEAAGIFSQENYASLDPQERLRLQSLVTAEIKTNRYDPATGVLRFTEYQAEALAVLTDYYTDLFTTGNERMGLQPGIVRTAEQGRLVTGFFTWLAWAAGTQRLDAEHTYTTN